MEDAAGAPGSEGLGATLSCARSALFAVQQDLAAAEVALEAERAHQAEEVWRDMAGELYMSTRHCIIITAMYMRSRRRRGAVQVCSTLRNLDGHVSAKRHVPPFFAGARISSARSLPQGPRRDSASLDAPLRALLRRNRVQAPKGGRADCSRRSRLRRPRCSDGRLGAGPGDRSRGEAATAGCAGAKRSVRMPGLLDKKLSLCTRRVRGDRKLVA